MKKLLSVLTSGVIMFGSAGFSEFPVQTVKTMLTASAADHIDGGSCGKRGSNVTWMLDSEGTLTISGTGEIKHYAFESSPPWDDKRDTILKIIIENGVTSIGMFNFYDCKNLESVIIADSVTTIAPYAFAECKKLESITIPDSVTYIGTVAFENTLWLENKHKENSLVIVNGILIDVRTCEDDVVIPDSVTSIVSDSFYHCTNLKSIVIPYGVTYLEYDTFYGCNNLESVAILNPECIIYDDLCPCNKDTIIKGCKNSTAEEFAHKNNMTFIALDDEKEPVYGDTNCDGKVSVADAVAILQSIGNRDKYALTEQGAKNADVDGIAGITGKDALVIQQVDAGLYNAEDLPLKAK